jgi:hypothetical protein
MADDSANSQRSDKNSTSSVSRKKKREPLSKSDALQILMAALNECIRSGLSVYVDHTKDGVPSIQLEGTEIVRGKKGHEIVMKEPSD